MTSETASVAMARERRRAGIRWPRVWLHAFLIVAAVLWLAPVLWALYTSLRPYSETAEKGYVSLPDTITLDNYTNAWTQGEIPHYFLNSLLVTLPALVITLFFASFIGFVASRLSFRFNAILLIVFLAANLLPPQVMIPPLYRMYLEIPLPTLMSESGKMYDSLWGLIAINVAFQTGFCAFVLSNYMRTIPQRSPRRRGWTARGSCGSSSGSSCRCAGRRWRRWRRSSSPGSTTTSCGRSC